MYGNPSPPPGIDTLCQPGGPHQTCHPFQGILVFVLEKRIKTNHFIYSLSQPAAAWGEKFESDQFLSFWLLVPGVTLVALASWKPPYFFFCSADPPPKSSSQCCPAARQASAHVHTHTPVTNSYAAKSRYWAASPVSCDFAACGSVQFPPYKTRRLSC
jgi:hypothetical protein